MSYETIQKLQKQGDCPNIYVLNMPEQLNGAYLFREPIYYIQDLFFPDLPAVKELSKYPIYSVNEVYSLQQQSDSIWVDSRGEVSLTFYPKERPGMVRLKNKTSNMVPFFDEVIDYRASCFFLFTEGELKKIDLDSKEFSHRDEG